MRYMVGADGLGQHIGQLTFLAPFLLSSIAFSLLFIGMPNRSVVIIDGILGGLVAAGLFEALKKGFGYYVINFPTYQTIYGAVAIVPIFLLWMYLTWIVVLLGAQVGVTRSGIFATWFPRSNQTADLSPHVARNQAGRAGS
jgi:membrane protein